MTQPQRIVAIGSSTLYGIGDPINGGFIGRLRLKIESENPLNRVFNLGFPGDTTSGLLQRFYSEVAFRRPSLVIIYPGINDVKRLNAPETDNLISKDLFKNNIKEILAISKTLVPNTILITSIPIDESRTLLYIGENKNFFFEVDVKEYL